MDKKCECKETLREVLVGTSEDFEKAKTLLSSSTMRELFRRCALLTRYSINGFPWCQVSADGSYAYPFILFYQDNDEDGQVSLEALRKVLVTLNDESQKIEFTETRIFLDKIGFEVTAAVVNASVGGEQNPAEELLALLETFFQLIGAWVDSGHPRRCDVCSAKEDDKTFIYIVCQHIADGTARGIGISAPLSISCADCRPDLPESKLEPEMLRNVCATCLEKLLSKIKKRDPV